MPGRPNNPPPRMMAKTTQKAVSPVDSPKILGPMICASICWVMIVRMRKMSAYFGSTKNSRMTEGMPPMSGPKKG